LILKKKRGKVECKGQKNVGKARTKTQVGLSTAISRSKSDVSRSGKREFREKKKKWADRVWYAVETRKKRSGQKRGLTNLLALNGESDGGEYRRQEQKQKKKKEKITKKTG